MDSGAGQRRLQRAGFAVVLLVAVATVGFAAVTGPSGAPTSSVGGAVEDAAEVATRSGWVIDRCVIEPRTECANADLRGADLRGANLAGAGLLVADLRDANLRYADLREANLDSANLSGADLFSADLRDADLSGAVLRDANLADADLRGANLHHTVMPDGSRCSRLGVCSYEP